MSVHFWDTRQLARELREGSVTAEAYASYIGMFVLQAGALVVMAVVMPATTTIQQVNTLVLPGVFSAVWVVMAYAINRAGDGRDFVKRLICLDLPVSMRLSVGVMVAYVAVYGVRGWGLLQAGLGPVELMQAMEAGSWWESVIVVVSNVYFLWATARGFRIAAGVES